MHKCAYSYYRYSPLAKFSPQPPFADRSTHCRWASVNHATKSCFFEGIRSLLVRNWVSSSFIGARQNSSPFPFFFSSLLLRVILFLLFFFAEFSLEMGLHMLVLIFDLLRYWFAHQHKFAFVNHDEEGEGGIISLSVLFQKMWKHYLFRELSAEHT